MIDGLEIRLSTATRYSSGAGGCCIDALNGLRSFRTHINRRAISCILILSRGTATICLSTQREKARCPPVLYPSNPPPHHHQHRSC